MRVRKNFYIGLTVEEVPRKGRERGVRGSEQTQPTNRVPRDVGGRESGRWNETWVGRLVDRGTDHSLGESRPWYIVGVVGAPE